MRPVHLLLLGCSVLAWSAAARAEDPKVIQPAGAKNHVDEIVTVEMTVHSSRLLDGNRMCFLNSETDHRTPENFTVVIFADGLERFAKADIADPAAHYRHKKIRATGKVYVRNGQYQLKANDPEQIKIVEDK